MEDKTVAEKPLASSDEDDRSTSGATDKDQSDQPDEGNNNGQTPVVSPPSSPRYSPKHNLSSNHFDMLLADDGSFDKVACKEIGWDPALLEPTPFPESEEGEQGLSRFTLVDPELQIYALRIHEPTEQD